MPAVAKNLSLMPNLKFELPLAPIVPEIPFTLAGYYMATLNTPRDGKQHVLAGVIQEMIDGDHVLVETVRLGGAYDMETGYMVFNKKDLCGPITLFKSRKDWLQAVQKRMKKME